MMCASRSTRLCALAGLALSSTVFATNRAWLTPGGGFVSVPVNWSPAGLPVAADTLAFSIAGTFNVTFDVATVTADNFGAGTWNISASTPHTAITQISIGNGGTSSVNMVGGSFTSGGTIGVGSTHAGTFTVTGPATSLNGTNPATLLRVGNSGGAISSAMSILNGALTQTVGGVSVGAFGGSQGTLLVSGVSGATHSRLITTDASAGDITLGTAGNGTMTVTAGGEVTCADDFNVAPTAGFTGVLNAGGGVVPTINVGGDLLISSNGIAAASGLGTVNISDPARVFVNGAVRVGDTNGGIGTLNVTGGLLDTAGLAFDPVNGVFQHTNGTVRVSSTPMLLSTPGLTINGGAALDLPTIDINDGGTLAPSGAIVVGSTRRGLLRVGGNSAVITPDAAFGIVLGQSPGSFGQLAAESFGRVANSGSAPLIVGGNGSGLLDIQSNGIVEAGTCDLGAQIGSSGTATVNGAGALFDIANDLFVGGSSVGSRGTGAMTISNGGTVSVADAMTVYASTGSLTINNGTLNVGGVLTFSNSASTLSNCTVTANQMIVNNTDISASGTINARINLNSGTTNLIATGPLTMGNASAPNGYSSFGSLNVGAFPVTLLDSSEAIPGIVTMSGGSLSAANGVRVQLGDSISGTGTVHAAVTNLGSINASGTGLRFNGLVSGIGQGIGGTKILFGSTGGFSGTGSITSAVENSGTITATGPLTIGDGSTFGLFTPGTLLVGPHHVTIRDNDGLPIGQCTLGGGNLELVGTVAGRNLNTAVSSHLKGFGTLTAPIFYNLNGGQISPGNPGDTGTGALFFSGNYLQALVANASGALNVDIRDSESVDQLVVSGSAICGGTLNVTLANSFTPAPGSRFTFLSAASVSGIFTIVSIPQGSVLLYNPDNVQVLFPCPSDFNKDGTVDFFDYLDFVDAFSNGDLAADFNNDTSLDFFDYLDFVDAFSAGC